ncbi:hypothetical protein OV090_44065 [Nannocystis sp. RBIL2]|uniref:hypothetical protein n=1 Tax=Nannocystis sp. RBIL2 TaxID=2996788 RepID=UPI002271F4DF|nr:hypothetical protein [Nannocystis sp. RBIL2]MCY1071802.1 hypothetical protein [Nannocystis sp. RBIL2]
MSRAPRFLLAATLLSPACAGRRHEPPLTESALRAELDRHTCARWEPEVKQWSLLLFDSSCDPAPASGDAQVLTRAAVARLRPLLLLTESAHDHFYEETARSPPPSHEEAQRLADAAVWSDRLLSGAVWQALARELAARGLACGDCPRPREPPPITARWAEFFPYLAAYVWPVQLSEGAPVEIFTCSEVHGAAALPVNPTLTQAGQLAAFAFAEDETAARQIHALASQGSLAEILKLVRSYLDSPESRRLACAALADVAWFTGLRISDC